MNTDLDIKKSLLSNGLTVFYSDFGKKGVTETWDARRKKQVANIDQFKDFQNYNIITGENNYVDIDLDRPETRKLADEFLAPTQMEFGRESTKRSHRIYKVIDLEKKHTRTVFDFVDPTKSTYVELRAHKHYTMCYGQYENGEKVVWSTCNTPTEITYDVLFKQTSMLAVASVFLKKLPSAGKHDQYVRYIVNAMYHHSVVKEDAEKILLAVLKYSNCDSCYKDGEPSTDKLAKLATYDKDKSQLRAGVNYLKTEYGWSDEEITDLKKLLYKVTGRHMLPEFTHDFVTRIAYMMKQQKYYDLEDKEMYTGEAIDVKYAKHFKNGKYTPLKFWKQHPEAKVCVDFTYKPDSEKRFVHVGKKLMINIFEKNDLQPNTKADTDPWDDLWEHVVPHEEYRNHLLDWCAYHVQNPGKKIRHAVILQSDEFQLGKGSLFDVMRDILGHNNTNKIDLQQALDKGKGYLTDRQLVLIDEAKASGSWSEKSMFVNTLKTIITEGTAGVRKLYQEYTEQDTCTNYWINTNFKDAFPLPYNEVRYFVYFSPAKRNSRLLEEFHEQRLEGELNSGVLAQLMDRNISKFKPKGLAPETPFLQEMVKSADRPIADFIREQHQQQIWPFSNDLVSTSELFKWFGSEVRNVRVTRENEIANALKGIGGVLVRSCDVQRLGKLVNIWVINNHEKYKGMSAKSIGKEFTVLDSLLAK